ncbi:MAG: tRNA uridine-5-carboxymethylaminomethyl(34) synthesis GTPase MnmE [Acidobacteria bacterium]|nr:tRNA uridine-5-carboxymethylaminomethyl(34) synthesis GTPase MnmE [Acidobacteriota bacterium]
MFATDDTIVAVATPPGRGGLGVVRFSGPEALAFTTKLLGRGEPLQPRHATVGTVVDPSASHRDAIDQVVATFFPGPRSYTGDDVVEITAHGSPVLLERILSLGCSAGARLAEPGEFTLRAFLNGRLDLVQAEAVGDLIDAVTPLQARIAFDQLEGTLTQAIAAIDAELFDLVARLEASLDFANEGYHFVEPGTLAGRIGAIREQVLSLVRGASRGRLIREGCQVVILGKPNVGKSSVFNALVGSSRAIVTPVAGTTRDLVSSVIDLDGLAVTLIDSAGIRETTDPVEAEGVSRARQALGVAAAAIVVFDRSQPIEDEDRLVLSETAGGRRVVALNKTDECAAWTPDAIELPVDGVVVEMSARTGDGLEELRVALRSALMGEEGLRDTPTVGNLRHIGLLDQAGAALEEAEAAVETGATEEFVLADLQRARAAFEELTGVRTPDDVVNHIFARFCIGK